MKNDGVNRHMNLKALAFVGLVMLCGCVTTVPSADLQFGDKVRINARQIIGNDLTRAPNARNLDGVWSNQYHALKDDAINPSFRELTSKQVRGQFLAENNSTNDLTISLLESVVLQKARIADSIAFVGIVSALSPREYRCLVDANFQYRGDTVRRSFDHMHTLPLSWADAKIADKKNLVEICLSSISAKIQNFVLELTAKE